jgi:hypothetical protein
VVGIRVILFLWAEVIIGLIYFAAYIFHEDTIFGYLTSGLRKPINRIVDRYLNGKSSSNIFGWTVFFLLLASHWVVLTLTYDVYNRIVGTP